METKFNNILIDTPIALEQLKIYAGQGFGNMIKAVIDVEKGIAAVGAELHADEEQFLLEQGSGQKNLWGINIRVAEAFPECVEFDSMINLRPGQGNLTRSVEDENARKQILNIVKTLFYANN